MKKLLVIFLLLVFVSPHAFAESDARHSRYHVNDDDNFAIIYNGKRYGMGRDYRGYYPSYNNNSPMSEFLSVCADVKERKRDDCIQDAIKERQKLIEKYRD